MDLWQWQKMPVTSGNWTNGSLGTWHLFSIVSATRCPWTPLLFPPDPSSPAGGHWFHSWVKILKTDSSPFQLLHVLSPEAITETSGQGILTRLLTPSELMRIGEWGWRIFLATKGQHCQPILLGIGQVPSTCIYLCSFSSHPSPIHSLTSEIRSPH